MESHKSRRFQHIRPIKLNKLVLNSIFILALLILSLINIQSYLEVKNLKESNRWVIHTYSVLNTLDEALYTLTNLESDQRAFLITNDKTFLQELEDKKGVLSKYLEQLAKLTKDNPEQNSRVVNFTNMTKERLLILEAVADVTSREALNTPEGIALFNKSEAFSDQVKAVGQEIKSVELVLLNERNTRMLNKADTTTFIIILGSIISLILLIVPFVLANVELINRQIIEFKSRRLGAHLRQIIESTSEMIAALDEKKRFQIFNEAYQREFKNLFNKSLTIGLPLDDAFAETAPEKHELVRLWKGSMETSEATKIIDMNQYGASSQIYEFNCKQIIDEHKEIKGVVHTISNITEKIREHKELQEAYEQQRAGMHALKIKNEQITLLVEMSDILLAANSQEELGSIMTRYAQHLLAFSSGYLFIMHPSKNYLEMSNKWGTPKQQESVFSSENCWAIRLGRTYQVKRSGMELLCDHISQSNDLAGTVMCVPLMAQNDIYGLLYMEIPEDVFQLNEDHKLLITAFAELTALALANVRLRENLRYQSIRDALTGLYNRRYLEDALLKQKHQSERSKTSFAILMLDLDHFKKINDTFGHDAGDTALKEVGEILQNEIRAGDVASRYGGEEFVLMLHDIDLGNAEKRADNIRTSISKLQLKYGAQEIIPITISIGIAMYPQDSTEVASLIEIADQALYTAKKNGRNRIVSAQEIKNTAIKKPSD